MLTKHVKNPDIINLAIEFYMAPGKWLFFGKWRDEVLFLQHFLDYMWYDAKMTPFSPFLYLSLLQTEHVPQNSYVEILSPNVMILGGKAFGR